LFHTVHICMLGWWKNVMVEARMLFADNTGCNPNGENWARTCAMRRWNGSCRGRILYTLCKQPDNFHMPVAKLSLSSSRFWAATAPSFKGNLRLNLSQSNVAESAAGSRTTTTTVCKVVKSRENHVLTKRMRRSICS
jgi:hypothetical protein